MLSNSRSCFFLLAVRNRNKRMHTQHDAKHTIARTAPHPAPAPAAPPAPAPPRWGPVSTRLVIVSHPHQPVGRSSQKVV